MPFATAFWEKDSERDVYTAESQYGAELQQTSHPKHPKLLMAVRDQKHQHK